MQGIHRRDIVTYTLTAKDAAAINRRRTTKESISERIKAALWPLGAQAHIGVKVQEGDEYPLIVVMVGPNETAFGQVFLPGNDVLYVEDVEPGDGPGRWTK